MHLPATVTASASICAAGVEADQVVAELRRARRTESSDDKHLALLAQASRGFHEPGKRDNFFVAEMGWPRGVGWYESLFEPAVDEGAIAIGEASPTYTMFPGLGGVPERMARVIPSTKLIYLLRHPIDRMISSYLHDLAHGAETLPIGQALLGRSHYADTSRYALQIERYLRHFDESQLLILLTTDLERRPTETMDRVAHFLDLPSMWRPTDLERRLHTTTIKRVPRAWWRQLGGLAIRAQVPAFTLPERIARSRLTTPPNHPR